MIFNPFDKPLADLTEQDLDVLKNVAEGWYVEYKEMKPTPKKIAKSISSFANSYGGLYFMGIEGDRSSNCAVAFPGVTDSPDVIRDCVSAHVQPFPFFETLTIPLANGRKIIVAAVVDGENPPYISSDGRVYRRQEAASEPIYETDRHVIDSLYSKAKGYEQEKERFRNTEYSYCQEETNAHLEIFINPVPFKHHFIEGLFSDQVMTSFLNKFRESFAATDEDKQMSFSGNLPLDTLNTYHDSIALRNLKDRDWSYNGLTVELDPFGNCKMLIPLNQIQFTEGNFAPAYFKVIEESDLASARYIRFLDAKSIFGAIVGLTIKYAEFMADHSYMDFVEVKFQLTQSWRTTLYFDDERFFTHIRENGIPICMKDQQYFPDFAHLVKLDNFLKNPVIESSALFALAALALGVPNEVSVTSVINQIGIKKHSGNQSGSFPLNSTQTK